MTSISKIPPNLPFPKGGINPSLAKRGEGRFSDGYVHSILRTLVMAAIFYAPVATVTLENVLRVGVLLGATGDAIDGFM